MFVLITMENQFLWLRFMHLSQFIELADLWTETKEQPALPIDFCSNLCLSSQYVCILLCSMQVHRKTEGRDFIQHVNIYIYQPFHAATRITRWRKNSTYLHVESPLFSTTNYGKSSHSSDHWDKMTTQPVRLLQLQYDHILKHAFKNYGRFEIWSASLFWAISRVDDIQSTPSIFVVFM